MSEIKNHSKNAATMLRNVCHALLVIFALSLSLSSIASENDLADNDHQYLRGKKVFNKYCSNCHGENADGRGKALRLYMKIGTVRPSNFQIGYYAERSEQYLTNIVRDGGAKHSLSQYMPPFGYELSATQLKDVVYFIQKVSIYSTPPSNSNEPHPEAGLIK